MIKTELHAHTADDLRDDIPHTTPQLVDHAAALGYGALAVTLHDAVCEVDAFVQHARARGVVLLRGVERTIEGRHVLLINAPGPALLAVRTFDDLRALRAAHPAVLAVAPHPCYPIGSAVGHAGLDRHGALFDAVECNSLYTRTLDFNRRAMAWARVHGKPVVGNTDLHLLAQMGTTYSLVDAAPEPDAICQAIRAGRVELRTAPLPAWRAAWFFSQMVASDVKRRVRPRPGASAAGQGSPRF
jgi:predicted metal-dependent phosphoesterase TrpH